MTMDDEAIRRFERIEGKLSEIQTTLNLIAVQDVKINQTREDMSVMWRRIDALSEDVKSCSNFQASCPRATINWMWAVLIPMGLGILYTVVAK